MSDVITIIENDHREVERLFAAYAQAASPTDKDRLLDEIRLALAPHAAAEEILVYPTLRRTAPNGGGQASHAIDEHQEIKRILSEVDKMSTDDPQRDQKVADLQRAVEHHVEEEESQLLPSLRAALDAQRLEDLGELFQSMKPLLPTHPHPLVPGTATGQLLAGPLASVADRIRDFVAA
jgi:hemerythrin-like domain-containing protein